MNAIVALSWCALDMSVHQMAIFWFCYYYYIKKHTNTAPHTDVANKLMISLFAVPLGPHPLSLLVNNWLEANNRRMGWNRLGVIEQSCYCRCSQGDGSSCEVNMLSGNNICYNSIDIWINVVHYCWPASMSQSWDIESTNTETSEENLK